MTKAEKILHEETEEKQEAASSVQPPGAGDVPKDLPTQDRLGASDAGVPTTPEPVNEPVPVSTHQPPASNAGEEFQVKSMRRHGLAKASIIEDEAKSAIKQTLGFFPHLVISKQVEEVPLEDILVTSLGFPSEGPDLEELDLQVAIQRDKEGNPIKDEKGLPIPVKNKDGEKVYELRPDSRATVDSIKSNQRVFVPIFITPRDPSQITKKLPQRYETIDGRTRYKGCKEAKLPTVPSFVVSGFSDDAEQRAFGMILNAQRRGTPDLVRKGYLFHLLSYEERLYQQRKQGHRSGYSRLAKLVGFDRQEAVAEFERANFFSRWVAYASGNEARADANGRPLKNPRPTTPTQRWSIEQVAVEFNAQKLLEQHHGEINDPVLSALKAKYEEARATHNNEGAYARNIFPRKEDAHRAAQAYYEGNLKLLNATASQAPVFPSVTTDNPAPAAIDGAEEAPAPAVNGATAPESPSGSSADLEVPSTPSTLASSVAPKASQEEGEQIALDVEDEEITEVAWNGFLLALGQEGGVVIDRLVEAADYLARLVRDDTVETKEVVGFVMNVVERATSK